MTFGIVAAVWVGWGLRMGRMDPEAARWMGGRGMRLRSIGTTVLWVAWSIFLVVWLYFYADNYSGYQNVAIIFVSLLIAGGVSAAVWAGWRGRP